jgi:ABC-2 type transport system permease protein
MLKRIWAVIQKELIQTYRDKSTLGMLLAMPLLQMFLFGFAIDMNVDHIPTIVADQSLDTASRDYVNAMVTSGYLDVIEYASSQEEVVQAIDAGRASVGFVIPPDFDSSVERGTAQVLLLVDGSDLFTAQSAYNMATVIAQAHAAEVMMEKIERSGVPISGETPLDVRTRILYNPDMIQIWFVIPGMVAMILQTQSIAMTAQAVVREREVGTIEQLLVTPIRPLELLLGKIAPNVIIALINMLMVIVLGVFVFGTPFRGSFMLFVGLSFLYIFSGLGLGLLISTVAKNTKQALQLIMAVMLIGVVVGGFMFPRYTMPPLLYLLGYLFPMSYFIPISRGIISKGVGIRALWNNAILMAIYSVVIMLVAARSFKRGLD